MPDAVRCEMFRAQSTMRDGTQSKSSVDRKYHHSLNSRALKIFREHRTLDFTCNESFEIVEMAMMSWHLKPKTFAL